MHSPWWSLIQDLVLLFLEPRQEINPPASRLLEYHIKKKCFKAPEEHLILSTGSMDCVERLVEPWRRESVTKTIKSFGQQGPPNLVAFTTSKLVIYLFNYFCLTKFLVRKWLWATSPWFCPFYTQQTGGNKDLCQLHADLNIDHIKSRCANNCFAARLTRLDGQTKMDLRHQIQRQTWNRFEWDLNSAGLQTQRARSTKW